MYCCSFVKDGSRCASDQRAAIRRAAMALKASGRQSRPQAGREVTSLPRPSPDCPLSVAEPGSSWANKKESYCIIGCGDCQGDGRAFSPHFRRIFPAIRPPMFILQLHSPAKYGTIEPAASKGSCQRKKPRAASIETDRRCRHALRAAVTERFYCGDEGGHRRLPPQKVLLCPGRGRLPLLPYQVRPGAG